MVPVRKLYRAEFPQEILKSAVSTKIGTFRKRISAPADRPAPVLPVQQALDRALALELQEQEQRAASPPRARLTPRADRAR